MPAVLPAIAGAAASAAAKNAIIGIVGKGLLAKALTAGVGAVVSLGASAALGAFNRPKNSRPSLSVSGAENINLSQSTTDTHKIIYGRVRTGGTVGLFTTTPVTSGGTTPQMKIVGAGSGVFTTFGNAPKNEFLHLVVVLAAHELDAIEKIYFDETELTIDSDGYVTNTDYYVRRPDGSSDGANHYGARIIQALGSDSQSALTRMLAEVPDWTTAHRLRGCAYLYVRLQRYGNSNPYKNGVPRVTALVRGKKVFDPRTSTTAWSNNAALCIRDYISSNYGLNAESTEINDTEFEAAANVCDENVSLKAGGTEKRYTCNGIVDTAIAPAANMDGLITSALGYWYYTGGKFGIKVGVYETPTITLDEDWLAGEPSFRGSTPRQEVFNAIKGVYANPDDAWQTMDFPHITNTTYQTQDGGDQIYRDIELPFTTSVATAQRIAKILLDKGRLGQRLTLPCNYKALTVKVGDIIFVTLDVLGFSAKPFRVVNWAFSVTGIALELEQEDSTAYSWTPADDEQDVITPVQTNLPSAFAIDPPGNPSVIETLYTTANNAGFKSKATLTWINTGEAGASQYLVSYKPALSSTYIPVVVTNETTAEVYDLIPGVYDFSVQARTDLGTVSSRAVTRAEMFGKKAPPSNITGFYINEIGVNAHLTWNTVTDADVQVGGKIRIRYSSKTSGATWPDAIDLGDLLPGSANTAIVPFLAGTYLVKAIDSSGNESLTAASVVTTIANVLAVNNVASKIEAPIFTGTKTNMEINSDGLLTLTGDGLFDDATGDFDDASGFFDYGNGAGFSLTGSYQIAAPIDLGAVYTSRAYIDIQALVVDVSQTFDEQAGNFDDRDGLFDGDDISDVQVIPYIRTTLDNPSGSPTWTDWRKFAVSEITARGVDFKVEITSAFSNYNVLIDTLSFYVDVPDREERGFAEATLSGGTTFTYARPFFIRPRVGVTIRTGVTGDTFVISGESATGFTVTVYNSAGVAKAGTIDWLARGY